MAAFASILQEEFAAIGLTVNVRKCEVAPSGGVNTAVPRSTFQHFKWVTAGAELLGAPIGSAEFCASHTADRTARAVSLMEKLSELANPQIAYLLSKQCGGFCRLTYSTRVVPSNMHTATLADFDSFVRRCFTASTAVLLDDQSWRQVQLSISCGGIGLRSAKQHAEATYLSSLASSAELGGKIDPQFQVCSPSVQPFMQPVFQELLLKLPDSLRREIEAGSKPSQRNMSQAIDAACLEAMLLEEGVPVSTKAHLRLVSQKGVGAWLQSTPSREPGTSMPGRLFRIALRRRLRMPLLTAPSPCPCNGQQMDVFMDHALVCTYNGTRTIRHNALRDVGHPAGVRRR